MQNDFTANEVNEFDIAVIGMSGRFPGANNVDQYWQNLCAGVESISVFPEDELIASGIDHTLLSDPDYVNASPVLDGPGLFDAQFFGFSPREALIMDPQHRLFLECAYEALEQAGYKTDTYEGSIGVYGGASMNTYLLFSGLLSNFVSEFLPILIGSDKDYLATRVSYKLNLTGPSVTVQTACSTSLVAVHIACQSLLNRECDMALAGGVSVRVPHKAGHLHRRGSIFSPDGHCRAFDAKAQGTIFGSGVGIVVLKRLIDAVADGDTILAVIKGSAVNNDGSSKVDYTAPSVDSQSAVILEAQASAGVDADTVTYIEAHGTGTALGDPIEVAALTNAFRAQTDKTGFCAIGSVKTNIGHLDAAAGIAGLIKTILALKHGMIPPSLNFESPNPQIDFENSPFYVNSVLSDWEPLPSHPRRAGITSLGVGGTNAHIILEVAPAVETSGKSRPWQLFTLSAKSKTALDAVTTNLGEHLRRHPDVNLADVAYTLQMGRKSFEHRRIAVCRDIDDAVTTLTALDPERVTTSAPDPTRRDIVFMFSGQGSQYANMGLDLCQHESVFREHIDRCSEILMPHLSFDLRDIMYPEEHESENATEMLRQTFITQPALFAIEYALAQLWMSWGVQPTAMVGHSSGEYVAACLAGVLTLEDALALVATRGQLMQELPGGSMLAVFLSESEIQPHLNGSLSLALINGPSICVVSGQTEAIEDLENKLSNQDIACIPLHTSHAFHSAMMEPMLDAFTEHVQQVRLSPPQIPFVSNVTGTWITPDEATDPGYWARHVRQTVRFSDDLEELFKESQRILLEIGPGRTLSTLARQHPSKSEEHVVVTSARHPKEEMSDVAFILNAVGLLWLAGAEIDWSCFYAGEHRHRLHLPTYPFERKDYWFSNGTHQYSSASTDLGLIEEQEMSALDEHPGSGEALEAYEGAPRDEVERTIANIWRKVLGVGQVSIHDNYFELGGSSLMAVGLLADINRAFGKKLPPAILLEAPTIEKLAAILREEDWEASWSPLVEIQRGDDSNPPFFFIHAAGGNVLIYRDLARHLGPDQPCYGLQSQGLDGEQPFLTQIEDMASRYIKEIQAVQPEGPYLLGGYCMGGTVALEIARRLRAQGHEVPVLAFMETYNWNNMQPESFLDTVRYYIQKIEYHIRNFLLLDFEGKKQFILEKAKVARDRSATWYGMLLSKLGVKSSQGSEQYIPLAQLWDINEHAPLSYVPQPYPGRILNFRPVKQYALYDGPELGWDELATEGVEDHILSVYPAGMMVEPFVGQLADRLKVCIQKELGTELPQ